MSGARGSRFAEGSEPSRDAAGHSLPSDRSMGYVELQLVCGRHPEGQEPILGAWWIESHFEAFDASQVNERQSRSVELQTIPDGDGDLRVRYQLNCPKCSNAPQFRRENVDRGLEAIYEKGARAKIRRVRI